MPTTCQAHTLLIPHAAVVIDIDTDDDFSLLFDGEQTTYGTYVYPNKEAAIKALEEATLVRNYKAGDWFMAEMKKAAVKLSLGQNTNRGGNQTLEVTIVGEDE